MPGFEPAVEIGGRAMAAQGLGGLQPLLAECRERSGSSADLQHPDPPSDLPKPLPVPLDRIQPSGGVALGASGLINWLTRPMSPFWVRSPGPQMEQNARPD
jgi:hypothetical protein